MVKQLIAAAIPLLIQDVSKVIHYTRTILDFTILTKYLLHEDKTLS